MKGLSTLIIAFLFLTFQALSQPNYQPTAENLKNRESFQNDKFGLFIHWGIYSQLADGEWVQYHKRIPVNTYEKLAGSFNPTQFNAEEWVLMAKNAGQKYITITSKHHDGFCMYDSKLTNWDIVDATPFKRDVIKELSEACKKHDIKLALYYSLLDWHHPDYNLTGDHGKSGVMGAIPDGKFSNYVDYMCGQLKELLTHYGPIYCIWFDGEWESLKADWQFDKIYKTIHDAQPGCLIGNNHHRGVRPGEDFQMFEKDLPGANSHGWAGEGYSVSRLPLETCETMNGSWGFSLLDKKYKSTESLIHYLEKAAGSNSNFLLNIGPMSNGKVQKEFVDTLAKMGRWLKENGASVYNTRGSLLNYSNDWGTATITKEGKIYLHIINAKTPAILVQGLERKLKNVKVLGTGSRVKFSQTSAGPLLEIKGLKRPNDYSLILEAE